MKVNVNRFIDQFKGFENSSFPITINTPSEKDLVNLLDFLKLNQIQFINNLSHQVSELEEIYSLYYGKEKKDFDVYIEKNNLSGPKKIAELIYIGWGQKCVINLLPKEIFYELITWRNKEKITEHEQLKLSKANIGVVGNSVGSFAVRILAKLGVQNLNIAELKCMKPSNTPRMYHDSIRDYGVHKSIPLSRGLYEFNPYINLKLFNEGVNLGNIEEFLGVKDQKLDVLIDAADDGLIKLLLREYCKQHNIPLVCGFDEKGALVVTRYDREDLLIEKNYSFNKCDLLKLKKNDPEAYVNKLLDFFPGGAENLTERQKQTIKGVLNKTRGGFSQLAWEASLFSSFIAKATIDIVLGHEIRGESLIDLNEIITTKMSA